MRVERLWRRGLLRGTPPHYLLATPAVEVVHVVLISHCYFFTLITGQFYCATDLGRNGSFVASLAEKGIDCLELIPACNNILR